MVKKKLVIIQEKLMHYRVGLFNILSEKYDLTVLTSKLEESIKKDEIFFELKYLESSSLNRFVIFKNLRDELDEVNPDVIISTFDLRLISVVKYFFVNKNKKLIWWGLDKGASDIALKIKLKIANFISKPILFYSKHNMNEFRKLGLKSNILFFANNTFPVGNTYNTSRMEKKSILFVGSFDERKDLPTLIVSFKELSTRYHDIHLTLIGDGECFEDIKLMISNLSLDTLVNVVGRINDSDQLARYYEESFVSVSYGQAGLSVLQSLAFGVPFITHKDSISGSEKHNIVDGHNGFFVNSASELESRMELLLNNESIRIKISDNAYDWYSRHCTVENMASQFVDCIEREVK
ncbi:glycosyltransferase family 4 protein [Vibrio splendidus]